MRLIELKEEDRELFKKYAQEAFQFGYESVYGKCEELVLPDEDMEKSLNNENSYAYKMISGDSDILGGNIAGIKTIYLNRNNICGDIKPDYEINDFRKIKEIL